MGTNNLTIKISDSVAEAPVYVKPEYFGASLDTVNVVAKGMENGKATVDFIFTDDSGQKHIAMMTGSLVRSIVHAIDGVESR